MPMTIHSIFSLNGLAPYAIYSRLDNSSKKALVCSSKKFSSIIIKLRDQDRQAIAFEEEVFKRFKIVYCSLPLSQLHTLLFYPQHIIGLGETHTKDFHRKQNGRLVNTLYNSSYNLRVECVRSERAEKRTGLDGQLKYVSRSIRRKTKSWDIPNRVTIDLYQHAVRFISCVKGLLITFRDFDEQSLPQCIETIKNHFTPREYREIFKDPLSQYNRISNPHIKDKMIATLRIACAAIRLLNYQHTILQKEFFKDWEQRDSHLEKVLQMDVLLHKKRSLFLAGSSHVYSLATRGLIPSLYSQKGIPSLFLKSKNQNKTPDKHEENSLNWAVHLAKNVQSISKIQFFLLKQMIIQLDLEKVDCDTSHFGAWQILCEQVIEQELFSLDTIWVNKQSAV